MGVELCGFRTVSEPAGHRRARPPLGAGHGPSQGGTTLVLVSCDLIGVGRETTRAVRRFERGRRPDGGGSDGPLHAHPQRPRNRPDSRLGRGGRALPGCRPSSPARQSPPWRASPRPNCTTPGALPGIALNREYDRDAPPLEEVLRLAALTPADRCHLPRSPRPPARLLGSPADGCHPVVAVRRHATCTATSWRGHQCWSASILGRWAVPARRRET